MFAIAGGIIFAVFILALLDAFMEMLWPTLVTLFWLGLFLALVVVAPAAAVWVFYLFCAAMAGLALMIVAYNIHYLCAKLGLCDEPHWY
jgi:hypothetical protein